MKKRTDKKSIVTTRRQLLTLMGLGAACCSELNPISMITRSLVDGLIADAVAQETAPVKNFVSILMPGAPIRWMWDGFLNLNNETIIPNATVNNWLLSDQYISSTTPQNTTYIAEPVSLSDGRTVYLPPLWNRNLPLAGGGTTPMNTLLNNTLIMRGVDMQVDLGHSIGPAKVLFPLGANASLTGLVGDQSTSPLPVVGLRGDRNYGDPSNQGYKSVKGTSPTLVNSQNNALSTTLSPFINTNSAVLANASKLNSPAVQAAIGNAMSELGRYANSSLPGSNALYRSANNASRLFQTTFGDLNNQVYPTLLNKYMGIVQACARTAIPNIIPTTGTGAYNLAAGTFTSQLAYQFAVAEYLLVNGYSSAISMCSESNARVASLNSNNDMHGEGDTQGVMICHSFQFLSIAAMINELKRALIAANKWNETLIHISAEFSRSARTDGLGADHDTRSNTITMMSGAINGPVFIGNIRDKTTDTNYGGTYGVSAAVQTQSGSRIITNNVAASTAAAILGVQNPLTQSSSVVAVNQSGSGVTSLAETPKIVAT